MGKRGDRELAKLNDAIDAHLSEGHLAFALPVYLMADGILDWKRARLERAAQELILSRGLDVEGVNHRDWEDTTWFQVRARQSEGNDRRQCPWCAENIRNAAIVCRFCGREVKPVTHPPPLQQPPVETPREPKPPAPKRHSRVKRNATCRQCGERNVISIDDAGFICSNCGEGQYISDGRCDVIQEPVKGGATVVNCRLCGEEQEIAAGAAGFMCSNCGEGQYLS